MSKDEEYKLKINAYTPMTIPMSRLAEYMADFATMLGEKSKVHFSELIEGSVVVKTTVESEAAQKVKERIQLLSRKQGPAEALDAYRQINNKLKEDNGNAQLIDSKGAEIIEFPGINDNDLITYGPISQTGSIDGKVVGISGQNDPVSVSLLTMEGKKVTLKAKKQIAIGIKEYLYDDLNIRCTGIGRWTRNEDGVWNLDNFSVQGYEPLDDRPLKEIITDLRNIEGSSWDDEEDPWEFLENIRRDN